MAVIYTGHAEIHDTGSEVVVLGSVRGDESHNCDAMGCGSSHVVRRVRYNAARQFPVLSDEDKAVLRRAAAKLPRTIRTACTYCGDSTFDHVCDDEDLPMPENREFHALLARLGVR